MALLFTACASTSPLLASLLLKNMKPDPGRFGTELIADGIYDNLRVPSALDSPVIVTTFVDLNDLDKTSVFGRVMAEKLLNELTRKGFLVVEIRRAQDLFVKKSVGEMILTRDIEELAKSTRAMSILAGTYVATTRAVIINARLIDIKSPEILSSISYEVELTEEIENLIKGVPPF